MKPDILIIRDGERYRVLHGLLHLAGVMSRSNEVVVDVQNEGEVSILKNKNGFFVCKNNQRLPLQLN